MWFSIYCKEFAHRKEGCVRGRDEWNTHVAWDGFGRTWVDDSDAARVEDAIVALRPVHAHLILAGESERK